MTLLDAWQEGGITVPWSRLAKTNREKLFKAKKPNAEYYLIGGERPKNKRQDFGHLIILEVCEDGKGRILTDLPGEKKRKISGEFQRDGHRCGHSQGSSRFRRKEATEERAPGTSWKGL